MELIPRQESTVTIMAARRTAEKWAEEVAEGVESAVTGE